MNERARARSLLELLTESGVHIREGVPPALLAEEQSLLEALSVKSERHLQLLGQKHRPEEAVQLSREVRDYLNAFRQLRRESGWPVPNTLPSRNPVRAPYKQSKHHSGPNTLLLEYALGDTRSYLWAVSLNSFAAFELPGRTAIESLVRRFLDITTERTRRPAGETPARRHARIISADKQYPAAASALSKLLVSPVASMLGDQRLILVTDGVLQYLPFATLPDLRPDNDLIPLIANHEIVGLPSAALREMVDGSDGLTGVIEGTTDQFDEEKGPPNGCNQRSREGSERRCSMKRRILTPSQMTQPEARAWLIENDREGADYWRSLPADADFRAAVQVDLRDFRPHEARRVFYRAD